MKGLLKVKQSLSKSLFNPVEKKYIESLPQEKKAFSLFKMQIFSENVFFSFLFSFFMQVMNKCLIFHLWFSKTLHFSCLSSVLCGQYCIPLSCSQCQLWNLEVLISRPLYLSISFYVSVFQKHSETLWLKKKKKRKLKFQNTGPSDLHKANRNVDTGLCPGLLVSCDT